MGYGRSLRTEKEGREAYTEAAKIVSILKPKAQAQSPDPYAFCRSPLPYCVW